MRSTATASAVPAMKPVEAPAYVPARKLAEVPNKFRQYCPDSLRDSSKFSFRLLATDSATRTPSPAVVSAVAPVERSGRTDPFSSYR
jgi:hypothetical protein